MIPVESFELNHELVKAPYVREAGLQQNEIGAVVQKFDLRFIQPNTDSLPTAAVHTLEHFLSIFLREKLPDLIDISPMGCRTGFYLVIWNKHTTAEIVSALEYALKKTLDQTVIPAADARSCGNYKDHSLFSAREYAKQVLDQKISLDAFERRFLSES